MGKKSFILYYSVKAFIKSQNIIKSISNILELTGKLNSEK